MSERPSSQNAKFSPYSVVIDNVGDDGKLVGVRTKVDHDDAPNFNKLSVHLGNRKAVL